MEWSQRFGNFPEQQDLNGRAVRPRRTRCVMPREIGRQLAKGKVAGSTGRRVDAGAFRIA
jgi:hypothetical protein